MTNQAKEMGKVAIKTTTSLVAAKMVSLNINWFKEFSGVDGQPVKTILDGIKEDSARLGLDYGRS